MPRKQKCRRIGFSPDFNCFKPAGVPGKDLEEVVLTLDEVEAVRLADLENTYHSDAAELMNISRQTFGNIIGAARKKIADTIINGKILKIEGGNVVNRKERIFLCNNCTHLWNLAFGSGRPHSCPKCNASNIRRENSTNKPGSSK